MRYKKQILPSYSLLFYSLYYFYYTEIGVKKLLS